MEVEGPSMSTLLPLSWQVNHLGKRIEFVPLQRQNLRACLGRNCINSPLPSRSQVVMAAEVLLALSIGASKIVGGEQPLPGLSLSRGVVSIWFLIQGTDRVIVRSVALALAHGSQQSGCALR